MSDYFHGQGKLSLERKMIDLSLYSEWMIEPDRNLGLFISRLVLFLEFMHLDLCYIGLWLSHFI